MALALSGLISFGRKKCLRATCFIAREDEHVFWLDVSGGELTEVAAAEDAFQTKAQESNYAALGFADEHRRAAGHGWIPKMHTRVLPARFGWSIKRLALETSSTWSTSTKACHFSGVFIVSSEMFLKAVISASESAHHRRSPLPRYNQLRRPPELKAES